MGKRAVEAEDPSGSFGSGLRPSLRMTASEAGAAADLGGRFGGERVAQEVHVGRGVDDAQGAVDVEGVDAGGAVEALGEDALEDVSGRDVLLGAADGFEEGGPGGARVELQLAVFVLLFGLGQRAGEALLQAVEALDGAGVGVVGFSIPLPGKARRCDGAPGSEAVSGWR